MLGQVLTALVGFGALVASVPTAPKQSRNQINQTKFSNGGDAFSTFGQLGQLSQLGQLAQFAEADLLARVQSQLLLSAELQAVKDNIRINSLRARFPQVNTVLVTVTNVVDARNPAGINNRYLLNELFIDNGFADQQQVIMVTESQTYTVTGATPTATEATDSATSTLDLGSIVDAAGATPTASSLNLPLIGGGGGAFDALNLGVGLGQGQIIQQQTTTVTAFNPLTGIPLSFLNSPQALLLPYDTAAPTSPLIIEDPANIIYGGVNGLLVQGLSTLQADCAAFGLGGNAFVGGAAGLGLFSSVQQAVQFQLTSIRIGGATQVIPPSILLAHPHLAGGLAGGLRVAAVTSATEVAEKAAEATTEATAEATAEATSSATH
ncbi:hypothetical protein QBC34DRAFT_4725 [Podospora aff. communis PSN243]|uniref:Uncharacterized protein n=1 Tax=Podospora aff. communis PSN243 TaxID=3040156 RepID=A0AAV9H771_9PEZI|nr:hypothetical protein QBC34DRAFT_4725 [Podospora aff. communis PSN243]